MSTGDFAAIGLTLYAAHHVGDYWVQRDVDAKHKGDAGSTGRLHCLLHVLSYLATQTIFLMILVAVTGVRMEPVAILPGLAVSGITHYIADRRTPLVWLASKIPGKAEFLKLGKPREHVSIEEWVICEDCQGSGASSDESTSGRCWDCRGGGKVPVRTTDNPQLATGAWALDQSWHIFWGVFVAALVIAGLS
jgi:hypothetical protein